MGPKSEALRIAVFGTGALGSLLAARLANAYAGEVVVWGTWDAALETIDRTGIVVDGENARITVSVSARHRGCLLDADGHDKDRHRFDLVLVLVKSWQTPAVAAFVARAVSPRGLVVSLQNGLGNREALARHVDASQLAVGVTAVGARLMAPGHVRPGGDGGTVLTPPVGSTLDDAGLAPAERAFRQAGLIVRTVADLAPVVWSKLAVNCAINPLTAIARVPNGVLVETPGRRQLMTAIAREVAGVAAAHGVAFDHDPAERALEVAAATATNHTSMLQDVLSGRRTEIDAMCGAVAALAAKADVDVPLNRALAERVRRLDAGRDVAQRMAGAGPDHAVAVDVQADLGALSDLESLTGVERARAEAPQAVA